MLTQCPDCGQSLSTEAPACPHCGKPNLNAQGPNAEIEKAQAAVQVATGEVVIATNSGRTPLAWALLVALGPIGFLIDFIAFPSMRRLLSFFLLVIGLFILIMASLITDTKKMEAAAMISLIFLVASFISFAITMYLEARNQRKASR